MKYDKTRMLVTALVIILASALMPECAFLLASPPFSSTEASVDPAVAIDEYSPLTSSSTAVSVDPAVVIDDYALHPIGSNLSVDVCVSDVHNLFAWQVNMSWNPSVLNLSEVGPGSFFLSEDEWYGRPYDHSTVPYTLVTKSPTATTPSPTPVNWTSPTFAYSQYGGSASTNVDGKTQTYYTYAPFTGVTQVTKLEVGLETYTPVGTYNATEPEYIVLQTSNDGGTTWGPPHTISVFGSKILWYEDCTADFAWTTAMLTAIRVKIKYVKVGLTATTIYLDWIPVRVTDQLNVQHPVRAWDTRLTDYAQFGYGEQTGSFTVRDFGHNFPCGARALEEGPVWENSNIVQVDFYMKFEASASALGDRYRIIYDAPVMNATQYVLRDWTSAATPLGTYSWLNQQNPNYIVSEPNTWPWTWDGVSAIRFTVEVEKSGGDVTAQFNEYEAWVIVKYERPVSTGFRLERDAGWILYGQSTSARYPGVSGSGVLCTFNFTVVGYGCSDLKITGTGTKLLKSQSFLIPLPIKISRTTEDGYFRNALIGDANLDQTVNVFDILAVKSRWGRTPASPDWIREYDVNNDSAINVFDILTVKANWGRTTP